MSWLGHGRRLRAQVLDSAPGLPLIYRTFGGITGLVVFANVAGEIVIGVLLVALNAGATGHQRLVIAVVGACYGLLAVAGGAVLGFVMQGPTLRWMARGRTPTPEEARRALRNPVELAIVTGALWLLGALLMGILAAVLDVRGSSIFGLCGGLVLAGLTTAGVTYAIARAVGRPIAAIALAVCPPTGTFLFTLRARLALNWLLASGIPLLGTVLILSSPAGRSHVIGAALFTASLALVLGVGAMIFSAQSIGKPLRAIVRMLDRVGKGDLTGSVQVEDPGEIGMLQRGVNDMVAGLRERERIQHLFGQHVGSAVAEEAIHGELRLGSGEERTAVALFVDITGSTTLAQQTEPGEFVATLNRFFGRVVAAVESDGGLVNKFEGDAALCIFGAPVALADPASCALRAARTIRDKVEFDGEVQVGIGVALGPVIAGQIGAPSRLEYTVIGDAVNEAARLTELAKHVEGRILASAATVESGSVDERTHWIEGHLLELRGREMPTRTYRAENPERVTTTLDPRLSETISTHRLGTVGE